MSDFEARVAEVLRRRLPGAPRLLAAERLSGGASQETHRLRIAGAGGESSLALRRAPGGGERFEVDGGPGLAGEAALLRAARAAGVPEPELAFVLETEDGLGEGFAMEWVEGEALGARIVRDPAFAAVRSKLARQCGEILARIHAIDPASIAGLELAPKPTEVWIREIWQRYRDYGRPQPMIDFTARWLLEHLPPASPPRLVHNDFRCGNLMVHPSEGIVAVLDWELAHLGDPLRDLGWLCTPSWRFGERGRVVGGFGEVEDLLAGYEAVSGIRVAAEALEYWTVFGSFWWAVGCLTMATIHCEGLDPGVERAAIGRRSSECQVDCAAALCPGPVSPLRAEGVAPIGSGHPSAAELADAAADFLRSEVRAETQGRTQFLSRVAAGALGVVARELRLGPEADARECESLRRLLGRDGALESLRGQLADGLREGSIALEMEGLGEHLRQSVADRCAIDQPRYHGLAALA